MANRMKEEDKTESIIRNLLKLPDNRRCINCNSLGPRYVCTTFLMFVCTNCSGVHREFTHRVKSVSMAKFTAEDVAALQAGGNERARQIYFKEWDPQRHSYPDGSNIHRLREFIKHVYVDRKYTGERNTSGLSKLRLIEKDSFNEIRKVSARHGGLRSPRIENRYDRHYGEIISPGGSDKRSSKYYYDEQKGPRFSKENLRNGGYRRSLAHIEIVDERIRDDGYGSSRFVKGEFNLSIRSPDSQKNIEKSYSPLVRRDKDKFGENLPPKQVGADNKAHNLEDAGGSAHNQSQNVTSSTEQESGGNPREHKTHVSECLIDMRTNFETSDTTASSETQQIPSAADNDYGKQASFELSAKEQASLHAPTVNTLESLLLELSVPSFTFAEGPGGNFATGSVSLDVPVMTSSVAHDVGTSLTVSTTNVPVQLSGGSLPQAMCTNLAKIPDGQRLPSLQKQQPSASATSDSGLTSQNVSPQIEAPNFEMQPWVGPLASDSHGSSSTPSELSEAVSIISQDAAMEANSLSLSKEATDSGRKELPADLFTANYSLAPPPYLGWQADLHHVMDYRLQHPHNTMPVTAYANPTRSTNPFDLNDGKAELNVLQFPSMASLQGALPQGSAPTGLVQNPGFHMMVSPSPSHSYSVPPQPPSFASLSPSAGMNQLVYTNVPPLRLQRIDDPGGNGAIFGSLNTTQQPTSRIPDSSSFGQNPFG